MAEQANFKNSYAVQKSHKMVQMYTGDKISKYCTCPEGLVTQNFLLSCKHMHLSFKSVCNKELKGVMCMTSLINTFQSTRPTGRLLWEELLVLSKFYS